MSFVMRITFIDNTVISHGMPFQFTVTLICCFLALLVCIVHYKLFFGHGVLLCNSVFINYGGEPRVAYTYRTFMILCYNLKQTWDSS